MDIEQFYMNEEDKHTPARILKSTHALPTHPKKKWIRRALTDIDFLVIHQAFSSNKNTTFTELATKHITPGQQNFDNPQGFAGFRYHYGIGADGQIYEYNAASCLTHHTNHKNHKSMGILVLGDFNGITYKGEDGDPNEYQMRGLLKLLKYLIMEHESLNIKQDQVYGHNEFGKENCPGTKIYEFIKSFRTHEFETATSQES